MQNSPENHAVLELRESSHSRKLTMQKTQLELSDTTWEHYAKDEQGSGAMVYFSSLLVHNPQSGKKEKTKHNSGAVVLWEKSARKK